jgi:hypothetical protein
MGCALRGGLLFKIFQKAFRAKTIRGTKKPFDAGAGAAYFSRTLIESG